MKNQPRDFDAELTAARDRGDWLNHSRIWEDRSIEEVRHQELALETPLHRGRSDDDWSGEAAWEMGNERRARNAASYDAEAYDEMVRDDLEGKS